MDGDRPSAEQFERVVGGLMDRVGARFPSRRIRAFGEMVDLLCERGNPKGAAELEELWNRLARRRSFSLLCGYRVDVFDQDAQVSLLPAICRSHSHVLPARDPERLERAVDAALEETLGQQAGQVYAMVGEQLRRKQVPPAQLALMWVSSQMPRSAERILESAREHYLPSRPPSRPPEPGLRAHHHRAPAAAAHGLGRGEQATAAAGTRFRSRRRSRPSS